MHSEVEFSLSNTTGETNHDWSGPPFFHREFGLYLSIVLFSVCSLGSQDYLSAGSNLLNLIATLDAVLLILLASIIFRILSIAISSESKDTKQGKASSRLETAGGG